MFVTQYKAVKDTKITVLGQGEEGLMEYEIDVSPKTFFHTNELGLIVSVIKGQRLNKTWDNRIVLKMENVLTNTEKNKLPPTYRPYQILMLLHCSRLTYIQIRY